MKRRFLWLLILLFLDINVILSQTSSIWPIGWKEALKFDSKGKTVLVESNISQAGIYNLNSALVSSAYGNCKGELQLYASEGGVWNYLDSVIQGGELLGFGGTAPGNGQNATMIIPWPNKINKYYLFHSGITLIPNRNRLMMSCIDMEQNLGKGRVIFKDSLFAGEHIASRNLTFANHKNGRDIWLITTPDETHLNAYLIDSNGLQVKPVVSNGYNEMAYFPPRWGYLYSDTHINDAYGAGIVFSKDQKNLVTYGIIKHTSTLGNVLMYDFDNNTGQFTFKKTLFTHSQKPANSYSSAACFSPNDSIIYIYFGANFLEPGYYSYLYALNRYTNAKILIRRFPYNFKHKSVAGAHLTMQSLTLAPDNRIYSFMLTEIWRIEKPNIWGPGCMYRFWDTLNNPINGTLEGLPRIYGKIKSTYFESLTALQGKTCQDSTVLIYKGEGNFSYLSVDWGDGLVDTINSQNVVFGKKWKHLYVKDGFYPVTIGGPSSDCGGYFTYTDTLEIKRNPVLRQLILSPGGKGCRADSAILNWKYENATKVQIKFPGFLANFNSPDSFAKLIFNSNNTLPILVTATGKNTCAITDTLLLQPQFLTKPRYNISYDTLVCDNLNLRISINAIEKWDSLTIEFNNIKQTFKSDSILALINPRRAGEDTFHIITKSIYGCLDTTNFYFNAIKSPTIGLFTLDSTAQCSHIAAWKLHFIPDTNSFGYTNTITKPILGSFTKQNDTTLYSWQSNVHGYHTFKFTQLNVNGCADTQSLTLEVKPTPTPVMQFKDNICNNTLLVMNLLDSIPTFKSLKSSTLFDSIKFTSARQNQNIKINIKDTFGLFFMHYTATSTQGCEVTITDSIYVKDAPNITIKINGAIQCLNGNKVQLFDTFNGKKYVNWGDGNKDSNILDHSYTNAGIFSIAAIHISSEGCTDTSHAQVTMLKNPKATMLQSIACVGQKSNFKATHILGSAPIQFSYWNTPGFPTIQGINADYVYTKPGNTALSYTAIDSAGCADSINIQIQVLDTPIIKIQISPEWANNQELFYEFDALPTGMLKYEWLVSTFPIKFGPKVKYTFPNIPAMYIVKLNVTSPDGCPATQQDTIYPLGTIGFYFPNAITLDRNGLNESFGIAGPEYIKQYDLKVFNRWGQKVFETTNPFDTWKPNLVLIGQYIYTCRATDIYNREKLIQGTVLVLE